jgi:hypothetical protein
MSDADLEQKLRGAAANTIPGHDVAPLIEAVWQLEGCEDVAKVAALSVPRR